MASDDESSEADETFVIPRATKPQPEGGPGHFKAGGDDLSDEDAESMLAVQTLERHRKERKRKRIIRICVIAAAVLLLVCVFVLPGLLAGNDGSGTTIATSSAYRGSLTDSVTASGSAQPVTSVWAVAEVEGTVGSVNVTEGQQVAEGDVLFTINSDDLQREVSSAQTAVDNAQRSLDAAKAQLADARNASAATDEAGNPVSVDLGSYQDAVTAAENELASAKDQLSSAQAQAAKCQVRAPQAGTVISCTAESGQSAMGSMSASGSSTIAEVQIADLSQMRVTVQVDEDDITKIAVDQKATVTFSALPDVSLEATVTHIAITPSGEDGSSYSGYSDGMTTTYDVDLLIPSPDPRVKPGMTADVEIELGTVDDAIIVPSTAVWEGDDGSYVTVVTLDEDGAIESSEDVKVEVMLSTDSESAVKGAVEDGDVVLLGGSADAATEGDEDTTVSVVVGDGS